MCPSILFISGTHVIYLERRVKGLDPLYNLISLKTDLVAASSLPEASSSGTIGAGASGVFLVFMAKEIPVILRGTTNIAFL